MPSGYQHPQCYARALGGCSYQISGEHYVTEQLLRLIWSRFGEQSQIVQGMNLGFMKPGESKKLTIGRLKRDILCTTHNSRLSPLDVAGTEMFVAMDKMNEYALNPSLPPASSHIDGNKLERWMLKVLCGGVYSGDFRLLPDEPKKDFCPPLEWLRFIFDNAELPGSLGLYYLNSPPGGSVVSDHYVLKFIPLRFHDSREIVDMIMWLFGFKFAMLAKAPPAARFTEFDSAPYRPAGIGLQGTNTYIILKWKSGPESQSVVFRSQGATFNP